MHGTDDILINVKSLLNTCDVTNEQFHYFSTDVLKDPGEKRTQAVFIFMQNFFDNGPFLHPAPKSPLSSYDTAGHKFFRGHHDALQLQISNAFPVKSWSSSWSFARSPSAATVK